MLIIDTSNNVSGHTDFLKSKNVVAVGRYFSSLAWKRITRHEAEKIAAAGLNLFTIFENDGDPKLNSDLGTNHAQIARQQALAIGQPDHSAIYFALEHLPHGYKKEHVPGIKDYFRQVRAVFDDQFKVGAYSDGVILAALLDSKLIDYAWLSASSSFEGSKDFDKSRRWVLAQRKVDLKWDGLSIDINDAKGTFGQFDPHLADALIAEATEDDSAAEAPEIMPSELAFTAAAKTTLSATSALTEPAPEAYALTAWEELTKPPPSVLVKALAQKINASPEVLHYARNVATAIVDGPKNHCAATLSALLVFIGIYPNGKGIGAGDLEPEVIKLDWDLRRRKGWRKIPLGEKIEIGDVGVVLTEHDVHHIYLVIDPTDQSAPTIADNQLSGPHARAVAGDSAKGFSPTNYFLRAPA